ncbi:unnamed protein product [Acanthosepion pharaonis]|uniref:Integrase catalytic domain-containing protein n=1 Tax=Acanthosepion pharaonis TaxID=158019 RepID=A0A812CCJ9_ACAPH|nr:unnamed protein product [Sepia pharaonis]
MDNGAAFRSEVFRSMLDKWKTRQYYRAAYSPSGNGIVERNHRTIKVIAERGGISPAEAVFWYNMSPKSGQREDTVPHRAVYTYQWRHPRVGSCLTRSDGPESIRIGEEVWVKPTGARCTTKWTRRMVTGAQSRINVEVDGMPRHILDLRVIQEDLENEGDNWRSSHEAQPKTLRKSQRERHPPRWNDD